MSTVPRWQTLNDLQLIQPWRVRKREGTDFLRAGDWLMRSDGAGARRLRECLDGRKIDVTSWYLLRGISPYDARAGARARMCVCVWGGGGGSSIKTIEFSWTLINFLTKFAILCKEKKKSIWELPWRRRCITLRCERSIWFGHTKTPFRHGLSRVRPWRRNPFGYCYLATQQHTRSAPKLSSKTIRPFALFLCLVRCCWIVLGLFIVRKVSFFSPHGSSSAPEACGNEKNWLIELRSSGLHCIYYFRRNARITTPSRSGAWSSEADERKKRHR